MNRVKRFKKWAEYRTWPMGYYHLVVESFEKGELFNNDSQFVAGMNTVALVQFVFKVVILVFDLMVNHAHFLVRCTGSAAVDFFIAFKKRINSVLVADGFPPLPDDLGFKLIPIDVNDPYQLKDVAVYIPRNPYKANSRITPSGYIWSSNYLIFSDLNKLIQKKPLKDYTSSKMRKVLKSKTVLPEDYLFNENLGIILPESYVATTDVERVIGTSWNYCDRIVRNMDAYVRIAEKIGDRIVINDNELGTIIYSICKNKYGVKSYLELSLRDRCSLAVRLAKDYNIEPKRICRKLSIERSVLEDLLR